MKDGRKKEKNKKMEGCQKRKKEIEGREERNQGEKEKRLIFKLYYIRLGERERNRVGVQKEKTCLNVKVVMQM